MTTLEFTTLDVFTSTPYSGNPLAIVEIPSSLKNTITQEQKQRIAKEFNLSETVFLHESSSESSKNEIDIFTTDAELPFAGHPTIGSASWVLHLSDPESKKEREKGVLVTKAGPIPISLSGNNDGNFKVQAEVPHKTHLHTTPLNFTPQDLKALSSNPEIQQRERKGRLFSIVKGMTFSLVELDDVDMLGKVEMTGSAPDFDAFVDEGWGPTFVGRYYYVLLEGEVGEEVVRVRTRMVEAKMEDPATGSAACALSSFLALKRGKSTRFEITQGVEMGRRSEIGVRVEVEGGEVRGVRLEGSACVVMEGTVRV